MVIKNILSFCQKINRNNIENAFRNGTNTHYVYDAAGNLLVEADTNNVITRAKWEQEIGSDGEVNTHGFTDPITMPLK